MISNNQEKRWKTWLFLSLIILLFFLTSCWQKSKIILLEPSKLEIRPSFEEKIDYTFNLAKYKLYKTIVYLENNSKKDIRYPTYTENRFLNNNKKTIITDGFYHQSSYQFWAAGSFPGLIWHIYEQETEPKLKKYWLKKAILWSKPLQKQTENNVKDMTINNLFAFRPWYENSSGISKNQPLKIIFQGAKSLATPLDLKKKTGSFAEDMGVFGYFMQATRTDKKKYWHAFMDHTINVEQLLWAAEHNPNQQEALQWKNIALSHIKTLAKTISANRNPGKEGTWQRAYFEIRPKSLQYGNFLFNEGKQGWKDNSTWSRGQAWWIYASSVAFKYSRDPQILTIAQEAIDYYFNHLPDRFPGNLRREGDLIPPWDFDYALQVNPDTEKDTSAAAIAVSGILKLVESLPPENPLRQKYLDESQKTLEQLMSPKYLATSNQGMSILLHGCYHHYESISPSKIYDNGLIWGDYFLIDALTTYRNLNS
jgi:hypothetical protein